MNEQTKDLNNNVNDEELIDVLIAISVIAKRLAMKHQKDNKKSETGKKS